MSVPFFLWLATLILGLVLKDGDPAWFGEDTATVGGWMTFIALALLALNVVVVVFVMLAASAKPKPKPKRRNRW